MAVALCGCAGGDFDIGSGWFSKPLDLFGRNSGYTYSQLGESKKERPITAKDLVDANGACPAVAAPEPAVAAPGPTPPAADNAGAAAAVDAAASLRGGIALGMSECDVVSRLGPPTAVDLGKTPNSVRTAILTFKSGPRPGVYRFIGGRLKEMDRVDEPAPEPTKKKPAKSQKSNKNNGSA